MHSTCSLVPKRNASLKRCQNLSVKIQLVAKETQTRTGEPSRYLTGRHRWLTWNKLMSVQDGSALRKSFAYSLLNSSEKDEGRSHFFLRKPALPPSLPPDSISPPLPFSPSPPPSSTQEVLGFFKESVLDLALSALHHSWL